MKISEILNTKKISVSFEIFPPKKQDGFDSVKATALRLSSIHPDFMSITYGAGGSTQTNTSEIASIIENSGTTALAHLTCVRSTKEELIQAIAGLKDKGVSNVLALRGDLPKDAAEGENIFPSGLMHASNLVPLLKKEGFCVGGACYPEGHPESSNRDTDIENLKYALLEDVSNYAQERKKDLEVNLRSQQNIKLSQMEKFHQFQEMARLENQLKRAQNALEYACSEEDRKNVEQRIKATETRMLNVEQEYQEKRSVMMRDFELKVSYSLVSINLINIK